MKEKILAFLKTNAKLSGVPDNYLLGVAEHYSKTVTEETQIATTFTDGVVDFIKLNAGLLQTEGDRRATDASKTAVKTYRDKFGLGEDGKPIKKDPDPKPGDPKPGDPKPDPEMPEWAKKLVADNEVLKTKLETQEKEKTQTQLSGKVIAKLKEKGIPESYFKGRNLAIESEDAIDQLVASVETDFTGFKQEMAEQGVIISVPSSSETNVKEGEVVGKNIADKRNTGASSGVEAKKLN